jgi:hypothetical protein
MLPVIRRVMPAILAKDIQGVAPMVAPKHSIAVFRARAYDRMIEEGVTPEKALKKLDER